MTRTKIPLTIDPDIIFIVFQLLVMVKGSTGWLSIIIIVVVYHITHIIRSILFIKYYYNDKQLFFFFFLFSPPLTSSSLVSSLCTIWLSSEEGRCYNSSYPFLCLLLFPFLWVWSPFFM